MTPNLVVDALHQHSLLQHAHSLTSRALRSLNHLFRFKKTIYHIHETEQPFKTMDAVAERATSEWKRWNCTSLTSLEKIIVKELEVNENQEHAKFPLICSTNSTEILRAREDLSPRFIFVWGRTWSINGNCLLLENILNYGTSLVRGCFKFRQGIWRFLR